MTYHKTAQKLLGGLLLPLLILTGVIGAAPQPVSAQAAAGPVTIQSGGFPFDLYTTQNYWSPQFEEVSGGTVKVVSQFFCPNKKVYRVELYKTTTSPYTRIGASRVHNCGGAANTDTWTNLTAGPYKVFISMDFYNGSSYHLVGSIKY